MSELPRRVAALAVAVVASIFSIATSPPRPPHRVVATDESEFHLDPANPSVTRRYVVRLSSAGKPAGEDLTASFSAYADVCAEADFTDAGVCDGSAERIPLVVVSILSPDGGTTSNVPNSNGTIGVPIFIGCAADAGCEETLAVTVALQSGEQRAVVGQLQTRAMAEGPVLNDRSVNAELTITRQ